jgi:hypothetical protein
VSVQDRDAAFGTPQELAADGVVGRVAARADGTFAVPYATGVPVEPGPAPLRVSLRAPGAAAFAAGEPVAEDARQDSAVAFEPGSAGAPVVLYDLAGNRGRRDLAPRVLAVDHPHPVSGSQPAPAPAVTSTLSERSGGSAPSRNQRASESSPPRGVSAAVASCAST